MGTRADEYGGRLQQDVRHRGFRNEQRQLTAAISVLQPSLHTYAWLLQVCVTILERLLGDSAVKTRRRVCTTDAGYEVLLVLSWVCRSTLEQAIVTLRR